MARQESLGDPSLLDAAEVVRELGTDPRNGLSPGEAARRLEADGRNVLRARPPVPLWRKALRQFRDPLIYLLLAAVGISLVAWGLEGFVGWPVDALVILVIVVLNAVLGLVQEARAENAVAALQQMTEATSSVIRGGELLRLPTAELVRGDLLYLSEGDAVGADARLIRASSLQVQEASLTGESHPVLKDAAPLSAPAPLAERTPLVFKGTAVTRGSAHAVIFATGMQTEMGTIAEMLEAAEEEPTPLQREIAHVGKLLGAAVIAVAIVVVATIFVLADVHTTDAALSVLLLGVSLAVAAVPEGLPAILSVVLALGVQRMARRNAIVKQLSSVETLGSASVICSDKTGTLTRSEMTIERAITASGSTRITGVGYEPVGEILSGEGRLGSGEIRDEHVILFGGGSLASNAALRQAQGRWEIQGDPTEAAFLVAEHKLGIREAIQRRFTRVEEIPFTSERKMMSTIERDADRAGELVLITKGAPDVLLDRCTRVREGAEELPLDDARKEEIRASVEGLTDQALRTLAVAYRRLGDVPVPAPDESLERDLVFVGVVGIIDPPREEAAVAVADAHRAGIRVLMITGDHPRTAVRIAADLGIVEGPEAPVLTGPDLDALDDVALDQAVRRTSVYARVAPSHKLRIVDALQKDGQIVAMTGDGVNDAPALKSADIGIAMGITGTQVTKEAAKMILADDDFATIVHAVREGRGIFDNIRKFLRYLLSSNMGEVLTVFLGVVLAGVIGLSAPEEPVVLPLLATQILWINLVTDSGPALAMGVDPETEDVMARPPRGPDERVMDLQMWIGILVTGLAMAAATLLTIDFYLPGGLIEGTRDLANARTAGFTVLVLAQLFNCFNTRSETGTAFRHLFVNRWLWMAIALSVGLQIAVVEIGFLNRAFGTVPLDLGQWGVCVAMASAVLWVTEVRKGVERAFGW